MNSPCPYFEDCGGCKYLNLTTPEYRNLKSTFLDPALQINKNNFFWIDPPNRRKITLHVNSNNQLGFFKEKSKEIIAINSCYVALPQISDLMPKLQDLAKKIKTKTIQKIQLTAFDNGVDALFFLNKELDFNEQQKLVQFAKINKINISSSFKNHLEIIFLNSKNILKLQNGIELELDSDIFIQASQQGLKIITDQIRQFILENFSTPISAVDLYSGFGVYSFAISDLASNLELFEGGDRMVQIASQNAKNNNVELKSHQRDLFNFPLSKNELKKFDLAIINPPRNGASNQIKEITVSNLKNLIYVSCNPKTFARDFLILEEGGFKIKNIKAIDQFYSTDHFEIIVNLQRPCKKYS